jgi:hypothetical protein
MGAQPRQHGRTQQHRAPSTLRDAAPPRTGAARSMPVLPEREPAFRCCPAGRTVQCPARHLQPMGQHQLHSTSGAQPVRRRGRQGCALLRPGARGGLGQNRTAGCCSGQPLHALRASSSAGKARATSCGRGAGPHPGTRGLHRGTRRCRHRGRSCTRQGTSPRSTNAANDSVTLAATLAATPNPAAGGLKGLPQPPTPLCAGVYAGV